MFDYIKGIVVNKKPTNVVIEAGGIGYSVNITLSAYEALPANGSEAKVITYYHVKENPMSFVLYGFCDENERECFRQIISVSGVGPKTAMSILSTIGYNELMQFITSGNYLPLTTIPGVGRKTAERLAVELKDKFIKSEADMSYPAYSKDKFGELSKMGEVISALVSLGYNRVESDKMVKKVSGVNGFSEKSVEEIIKEVLKNR